jgi:hypothetical protein
MRTPGLEGALQSAKEEIEKQQRTNRRLVNAERRRLIGGPVAIGFASDVRKASVHFACQQVPVILLLFCRGSSNTQPEVGTGYRMRSTLVHTLVEDDCK